MENCSWAARGQDRAIWLIYSTNNTSSVPGAVFPRGNVTESPALLQRVKKVSRETFGTLSPKEENSQEENPNRQSKGKKELLLAETLWGHHPPEGGPGLQVVLHWEAPSIAEIGG